MSSTIVAVSIRREFTYQKLADCVLVPTKITVACRGVKSAGMQIHPLALPFGLLERVHVRGVDDVTLELIKVTGRSKVQGTEMLAVFSDSRDNQDAADPDIKLVKQLTGHSMQNRMVAAGAVVGVQLKFASEPPAEFFIDYYGANVLNSVAEARSEGPKYAFRLPPLTPQARMTRGLEPPTESSTTPPQPAQ